MKPQKRSILKIFLRILAMGYDVSEKLYQQACQVIPGGVNSPVRAFKGVGGTPVFFEKAQGAYLWDVDGNQYIDYVGSWGPAILGHANPQVISAIKKQLENGLSFGAPTAIETQLAQQVMKMVPGIEMIRMVSSGTEATMSAIRLARGYTNRKKILKFEGCYHGHSESLLVKGGSGLLTHGTPTSAGVPEEFIQFTMNSSFNDINKLQMIFSHHGHEIAAVIIEPVAGNMNLVLPEPEFLSLLRKLCDRHNVVLIFDEVMTGFRVAKGGAQAFYNIVPDLTTLGKVIGGGMPVGAFGGKKAIMEKLSPLGNVYQAGTLSGNPVAMVSGLETLKIIDEEKDFYDKLSARTQQLADGLNALGKKLSIPFFAQSVGGMFGFYFSDNTEVKDYQSVQTGDVERFKKFFHAMLKKGVYLAPSAFEAGFVSIAHTQEDIVKTLDCAEKSLREIF
ncbi:MAG: hemL [Gammaproteobacteria bacterium]|jgi:glutamate-1-semialdehyde 2,1-aminomutase|nr:hemL [Gammaproteobacteria bacterium]